MERGELMSRMWKSSHELFLSLVGDMSKMITALQAKITDLVDRALHVSETWLDYMYI